MIFLFLELFTVCSLAVSSEGPDKGGTELTNLRTRTRMRLELRVLFILYYDTFSTLYLIRGCLTIFSQHRIGTVLVGGPRFLRRTFPVTFLHRTGLPVHFIWI